MLALRRNGAACHGVPLDGGRADLFRREQAILGSNGWTHSDLLTITRFAFEGRLRQVIDRVLPLEETADGERALEAREVFGKVVIRP